MAKKKIEPIKSLGNESKLTVQKSLPLFSLWRSELTLAEFKILDTYLARIDSHNPDKRIVVFAKGELEKKLGVQKINKKDLEERLEHLMSNVVKIEDKETKKGFRMVTLFEEATAEQDDEGLWQITLECTQKAMKYFFNVENLGYLRYKLRCITSITSRYTYIMFNYLEHNRFRKSWEVPLDTLKEILDCNAERYKEFKYFKAEVLAKIQKELHEKTECKYTYESIKKGRTVAAIRFTLETLADAEDEAPQLEGFPEIPAEKEPWEVPLDTWNLATEEKAEIKALLLTLPEDKLPPASACQDSREVQLYHYIDLKAKEIERRNAKKPIKNKFLYLLKLMKNDAASKPTPADAPQEPPKQQTNRFNAFPQREYSKDDISDLERRLLNRGTKKED